MASRQAKLVDLLDKKQREGKLSWETTEKVKIFQTAFTDYSVRITERRNENGADDIFISVFNEEGDLLEEFSDLSVGSELPRAYETMSRLYESARREALGVDKALDSLLDELTKL